MQPTNTKPQPDYKGMYNQTYNALAGEVNKYADELIKFAQEDYDFAAKWIESQYKTALGTDDGERAAFLKQVASSLEERVGRIAFDYQTGAYRTKQDMDTASTRTIQGRDLALRRLSEDEQVFRQQAERDAAEARQNQNEDLNARGVFSGALAERERGELNRDITDELSAYERALGREREDITTGAAHTLEDINLTGTRQLEDLTTGARRGAIDETNQRQYGLDSARRTLDRQKLAAEQQRRQSLNQAKTYADYLTRGAANLG